jgi:methionyl-tRNA synthetase
LSKPTFYISTPIYYPSDKLHIGHAYTTVAADSFARYKRMKGYDVWFLTGSDEHGQKIERTAKEKGQSPLEYVDQIVAGFKSLWKKLDVSYDDFIRTTQERHKKVVQDIFQKLYDQGDIYKAQYEGHYCTPCETFWTEYQLDADGNCPDCGRPVEILQEESYFFKMSKYADEILKYIEDNAEFIQPNSRRNEMVSFIKSGLADLCVSRTTFDWGIQVPFDPKHVIYVWVDALTNYISALGYGTGDDSLFRKYWPADMHLVGKDIVRFHTIIWPIMLMAAGIELPKQVLGHGWLLLDSGKMSKSKGNVVDPLELCDKYGVDAIRYYLLRELPLGSDGYYSEEALVNRINIDLANDLGNLISRSTSMIVKFSKGVLEEPETPREPVLLEQYLGSEEAPAEDRDLISLALKTKYEVDDLMERRDISGALAAVWRLVGRANKYVEETSPWSLAKDPELRGRLATVLYNLAETIRFVTVMVTPFMPNFPSMVWQQLAIGNQPELHVWEALEWGNLPAGTRVVKGDAIFPRIDLKTLEKE